MHKPLRFVAALFTLFLIFGCTESEQQKWAKKSDWNFMVNTCSVSSGTVEIPNCSQESAEQAALKASNYMAAYEFLGPNEITIQVFVSPNHPYYNQIDVAKMTQVHTAPITYIKGKEPNTLSVVLHTNGCDVTTNYRLSEPGKVYEQTVSAIGSSCGDDQRAVAEYGLKDGPKLGSFTRN